MADADDDPELAAALAMSMGDGDGDSDAALASKLVAACGLLEAQPAEARATATKTLKKLVENLVAAPDNPKFRRVRVSNAKIQQAVLGVPGGEEFLRALGFKDSAASAEHAAGAFLEIPEPAALEVQKGIGALALAELRRCAAGNSGPQLVLSRVLENHGCEVKAVAALPDGRVATGGADNLVRLFPADGLGADTPPQLFSGHVAKNGVAGVNALLVAEDDGALLSGGKDGTIISWNLETGEPAGELKGHGDSSGATLTNAQVVSCLADAGGGRLLSGGWDTTARIWQRGGGGGAPGGGGGGGAGPATTLTGHTAAVLAVAVAEGLIIVTGGGDGKLRLWEAESGSLLHEVAAHASPVRGVATCGGTGHHFASGDNTGRLRRWGFGEDGKVAADGDVSNAHSSYIFAVVGMATEFLTAGDDCVIRRWPAVGPLVPTQEIRCPSPILAMSPLPMAAGLIAGLEDGTACVWCFDSSRAASGAATAEFEAAARARAIQLAAEDEFKAVQATGTGAASGGAPAAAGGGGGGGGGGYSINFPVELPGRPPMQVSWNPGESPEAVAERFLTSNSLGRDHLPDVISFVQQATQQMGAAPPPPVPAGTFDFEYPVELSMGGALTIQWNRGESPDAIADRFLARHNLALDNKPDIIEFVAAVQQQGGGGGPQMAQVAATTAAPDAAAQEEMIGQLLSFGFDGTAARAALEAVGWNVEAAANRLLS
jgi:hypothetical protein